MTSPINKPLAMTVLPGHDDLAGASCPVVATNHLVGGGANLAASGIPTIKMHLAIQSMRPVVREVR